MAASDDRLLFNERISQIWKDVAALFAEAKASLKKLPHGGQLRIAWPLSGESAALQHIWFFFRSFYTPCPSIFVSISRPLLQSSVLAPIIHIR
jgi:hypothetical protein